MEGEDRRGPPTTLRPSLRTHEVSIPAARRARGDAIPKRPKPSGAKNRRQDAPRQDPGGRALAQGRVVEAQVRDVQGDGEADTGQ